MAVAEIIEKVAELSDDEKNQVICGVVEKMTVLGLSQLVKDLEEKFGVSASAPAMPRPRRRRPSTSSSRRSAATRSRSSRRCGR